MSIFDYNKTQGIQDIITTNNAEWLFGDVAVIINRKVNDEYCAIKLVVKDSKGTLTICDDDPASKVYHTQKYEYTDYPEGEHMFLGVNGESGWTIMLPSEF